MKTATAIWARGLSALALLAGGLSFSSGPTLAQGPVAPDSADHYKVYRLLEPGPSAPRTVILRDQFGVSTHLTRAFEFFATPVVKDNFPLFDLETHYNWWRISPQSFGANVLVTNQFGVERPLKVRDAAFLLLPSIKFPDPSQPQPLPNKNHYKCYDADGAAPIPSRVVTLRDQFGFNQAIVDSVRFFCNPVDKVVDGTVYPMVDPKAHLVCYRITTTPPNVPTFGIVAKDQFGFWTYQLVREEYLCLPSLKTGEVAAEPKSWGSVKAMYR